MGVKDPLVDVSRRLAPAMPHGFRRKGRHWERSEGVRHQRLELRRDPGTFDGSGSIRFWVIVQASVAGLVMEILLEFIRPDVPEHRFVEIEESSRKQRWIFLGVDEGRLEQVASDVREAIEAQRSRIDEQLSESYLLAAAERRSRETLVGVLTALGHRERVLELLMLTEGWDWESKHSMPGLTRLVHITRADAVLGAYEAFEVQPSRYWIEFAEQALRPFRGRPPKNVRAEFDRVKQILATFDRSN